MGQKLSQARRPPVPERFTKPCGLYNHRNIDGKKLKKLILEGKLAPCYPGVEEPGNQAGPADKLEECPICFLVRPRTPAPCCCRCVATLASSRSGAAHNCAPDLHLAVAYDPFDVPPDRDPARRTTLR